MGTFFSIEKAAINITSASLSHNNTLEMAKATVKNYGQIGVTGSETMAQEISREETKKGRLEDTYRNWRQGRACLSSGGIAFPISRRCPLNRGGAKVD